MVIVVEKRFKMHLFIFSLLSLQLFVFTPFEFISRFLAAAICLSVLFHIRNITFEYKQWYEIATFLISNAYFTMAIFGYDLFLVDSYNIGKIANTFLYFVCFLWTSYVTQSALDLVKLLTNRIKVSDSSSQDKYWKKWILLFIIMCFGFLMWWIAFNPVIMMTDSVSVVDAWHSDLYNAFRSPVYAYLAAWICRIAPTKPELQWITFSHIVLFASLLATVLMYFHMKKVRYRIIVIASVVLPLIPSLGLFTPFIVADLAFGMSMLWLAYVLVRIIDEIIIHDSASKCQQLSFCVQLILSTLNYSCL